MYIVKRSISNFIAVHDFFSIDHLKNDSSNKSFSSFLEIYPIIHSSSFLFFPNIYMHIVKRSISNFIGTRFFLRTATIPSLLEIYPIFPFFFSLFFFNIYTYIIKRSISNFIDIRFFLNHSKNDSSNNSFSSFLEIYPIIFFKSIEEQQ